MFQVEGFAWMVSQGSLAKGQRSGRSDIRGWVGLGNRGEIMFQVEGFVEMVKFQSTGVKLKKIVLDGTYRVQGESVPWLILVLEIKVMGSRLQGFA